MLERKPKVLILEDRPEDAKEINQFLRADCEIVIVFTAEDAMKRISREFDCYVFDVNVPGPIRGHQILMKALEDGQIRVSCIAMTGVANIQYLKENYAHYFVDIVDKRIPGWMTDLGAKIIKWSKTDPRSHYMRKRFGACKSLEAPLFDGETIAPKITFAKDNGVFRVEDAILLLEDATLSESDKDAIYEALNLKLKKIY